MIVRDLGDAWQLITHVDHADLAGRFVEQWGGDGFDRPEPLDEVVLAAARHDDGHMLWDCAPSLQPDGTPRGEPRGPSVLDCWRACVAAVTERDPYAGMLVSMHATCLYSGGYGWKLSRPLNEGIEEEAAAFVEEHERSHIRLAADLGVSDAERWRNYHLVQLGNILSLYFCGFEHFRHIERGATDADATEYVFDLEPLARRRVRMKPYPFVESPARFELRLRVVPKREWSGDLEFQRAFFSTEPETVELFVEA